MKKINLGYSPCPNDTFLFHALAYRHVDTEPFKFSIQHHDIATLNQLALNSTYEMSKVSVFLFGLIRENYALLSSGAALGKGYGPLVLVSPNAPSNPEFWKIGFPGKQTTAFLLGRLWQPEIKEVFFLPFSQIIQRLLDGTLDAGVIIHESRFTFASYGLHLHLDLGRWWQEETDLPLPLGVICAKRTLDTEQRVRLSEIVKKSLYYAQTHPDASWDYTKKHAQESDKQVLQHHIDLYVNEYTEELGNKGIQAIEHLLTEAEKIGLLPCSTVDLF